MHFYIRRLGKSAHFLYNNSSGIGTFVHKVLSDFAISMKERRFFDIGYDSDFIEKSLFNSFQKISFSSKQNINYEKAWQYIKTVGAYFQYLSQGKSKEEVEDMFMFSEKSFKINLNNSIISGKFDLLIKLGREIRIVDYKTRQSNIEIDGIQIALYKYAVEKLYKIKVNPVVIYIEDECLKEGKFKEEEYSEIILAIQNTVKDMASYLKKEKIPPTTIDNEICTHCSINYNCKRIIREVFNE